MDRCRRLLLVSSMASRLDAPALLPCQTSIDGLQIFELQDVLRGCHVSSCHHVFFRRHCRLMPSSLSLSMSLVDDRDERCLEAWEPPHFQEKRSRTEKAILGALGEFRGILGAALGIQNSILGIQNSILGIASHDLSNTKTTILGATPRAIPGSDGNPHEIFSFAHVVSERFFKNWGGPRAPEMS